MSVKKFRFVSPGIFINEIDNSQLAKEVGPMGPVIIGRTARGPGMRPVQVGSFSEFVEIFGNPIPGGSGGDVWRDGNYTAPTYAGYAAQAWLRNASPCTIVRLLGTDNAQRNSGAVDAGWATTGSAYGLFVAKQGVTATNAALAAVVYLKETDTAIGLAGQEIASSAAVTNSVSTSNASAAVSGFTFATASDVFVDGDEFKLTDTSGNTVEFVFEDGATDVDGRVNGFGKVIVGISGATAIADQVTRINAAINAVTAFDQSVDSGTYIAPAGQANLTLGIAATDPNTGSPNVLTQSVGGAAGNRKASEGEMSISFINPSTLTSSIVLADFATGTDSTVAGTFCTGQWVKCQNKGAEFKIHIGGKNYSFNLDRSSRKFIRSALNTNPTLTNDAITASGSRLDYFLGETYERHVENIVASSAFAGASGTMAVLLKLDDPHSSSTFDKNEMELEAQSPQTSWIFSQHTGDRGDHEVSPSTGKYNSGVTNLFRLVGLDDGAWSSANLKVSISDIKASDVDNEPYGSFTVGLRQIGDTDVSPVYVERYTNCNLNPNSNNFIARRIGDMSSQWDETESRYKTTGQWPNVSSFVRVEVNPEVEAGSTAATLLPFGFYGSAFPRTLGTNAATSTAPTVITNTDNNSVTSADGDVNNYGASLDQGTNRSSELGASSLSPYLSATSGQAVINLVFPSFSGQTDSSNLGLASGTETYFGINFTRDESGSRTFDGANRDLAKPYSSAHSLGEGITHAALPSIFASKGTYADSGMDFVTPLEPHAKAAGDFHNTDQVSAFTLDDLVMDEITTSGGVAKSTTHVSWYPGARYAGASISVCGTASANYVGSNSVLENGIYKDVLDHGYDKFTLPLVGGFDGLDVREKDPFRNAILDNVTGGALGHYAYNSVQRAIKAVTDPEIVEMNLAAMPGITNEGLTSQLIDACEARGDALAVIDLEGDYVPSAENDTAESGRLPSVKNTITNLKNRAINSSYGCAYFPWVQIKDTISDSVLWSPPSVVALGTMASSQQKSELWFAPAGFNRGGLTEGSAGVPVLQARRRLTSKDRDKLYEANINPIATFPSEGLVIFGQKTLQVTPSALDRINVRRLLIYLKKEISVISTGILFDNNVPSTWHRFTSQVEPFLASVKNRFGLSDFKVVLDETTTTPDLIDRNILYAKILLKPARAIEFIAIDFVITNTGASFDD